MAKLPERPASAKRRGHGEGSVFQRADGRWAGTLELGRESGTRNRKTVYGTSKKDVTAKMRVARREHEQGRDLKAKRETVGSFIERWLSEVVVGHLAPKTIDQYQRLCRGHVIPTLGTIPLDKLSTADVSRLLRLKRDSGLAPKTVNHIRSILRAALNVAISWGLIVRNPVTATKPIPGESRPISPLSTEEMKRFLGAIIGDRDEPLYRLTVTLGLRIGETLGLRWVDVDMAGQESWSGGRPCLRIEWTLQRVPNDDGTSSLSLKRPKTAKSRRVLPIPAPLIPLLRDHRDRQTKERVAHTDVWHDTGLVFTTAMGTGIEPRNALRSFHAVCQRAGLERRRLHDLRHTAVTALLAQGVSMRVISELLGHSQMATTADLYGHILSETLADATDRLGTAWSG